MVVRIWWSLWVHAGCCEPAIRGFLACLVGTRWANIPPMGGGGDIGSDMLFFLGGTFFLLTSTFKIGGSQGLGLKVADRPEYLLVASRGFGWSESGVLLGWV